MRRNTISFGMWRSAFASPTTGSSTRSTRLSIGFAQMALSQRFTRNTESHYCHRASILEIAATAFSRACVAVAPGLRVRFAPAGALSGADGIFSAAAYQRSDPGVDLWPDRDRLHHGLRHYWNDQFRPWRDLYDRCVHLDHRIPGSWSSRHNLRSTSLGDRLVDHNVLHLDLRLGGRADRLPALARLVPACAADLGDWHVNLSAELRAAFPGRTGQADAASRAGWVHGF